MAEKKSFKAVDFQEIFHSLFQSLCFIARNKLRHSFYRFIFSNCGVSKAKNAAINLRKTFINNSGVDFAATEIHPKRVTDENYDNTWSIFRTTANRKSP